MIIGNGNYYSSNGTMRDNDVGATTPSRPARQVGMPTQDVCEIRPQTGLDLTAAPQSRAQGGSATPAVATALATGGLAWLAAAAELPVVAGIIIGVGIAVTPVVAMFNADLGWTPSTPNRGRFNNNSWWG